jgi:pseudaminic acid synthase
MNEAEFTAMVKAVREAEKAVGVVDYQLTEKQKSGRDFSRSLYIVKDVLAGEKVTAENIRSIRPGFGLHPKHYNEVLGKTFREGQVKGTRFALNQIVK